MTKRLKISICAVTILLVLIATVTIAVTMPIKTTQSQSRAVEVTWDSWTILKDFVTQFPDRAYATQGELDAGNYIIEKFNSIGLTTAKQKINEQNSYNIIGSLNLGKAKKIVIGAHYDNAVPEGASDNGSGVTAMLILAEQLYAIKDRLDYNIDFVAFGGEEVGLYGSLSYCYANANNLDKIALMINFDTIASGDNVYIYGEDKRTDYQKLFYESANGSAITLYNKPINKDIRYGIDSWGYGYYQTLQNSDHTAFRTNGVPTLMYTSGTFQNFFGLYYESNNAQNNVMNTDRDTIEHLETLGQQLVAQKIDVVVQSVLGAFQQDSFAKVVDNAVNELVWEHWKNTYYVYIGIGVVLIIMIVLAVLHYKKLDKQSILGYAEARDTTHSKIFRTPDADQVFELSKKKKNRDDKDDKHDIF